MQDRIKVLDTASRMNELREQGFMSDVVLISEEGTEVYAHRFVLSAACLYFQAKFASQISLPSEEFRLELKGIGEKALSLILKYLYSGNYPTEDDILTIKSVLVTADFLQLPQLVCFCREILVKKMSLDNCLQLLDIPTKENEKSDEMMKYAAENFHKLYYTPPYLALEFEHLTTLIKSARQYQNDDVLLKGVVDWVKFDIDNRIGSLVILSDFIDIDKLSYNCLQSLSDDLLVKQSAEFARLLFKSSILSMDTSRRLQTAPKHDFLPSLKLDFLVNEFKNYNFTCMSYSYYFDDNLWSEPKILGSVSEKKVVPLCKSGNFLYYFEQSGKNLVKFYKMHYHVNFCEEIEYPYERYDIFSAIDKDGDLFMHIANRLIRFKPRENVWQMVCSNLPTSSSVLVSCDLYIFCIVWDNTNLIRIHTESRSKVYCSLPENYKLCGQKIASSMNKLYFYEDKKKYLVVYNSQNNDWQSTALPAGIRQLGDKWEFCFLRKPTPCLIFIDEFKLVWKYYPDSDTWRRISSDAKYVTGLIEISNSS